MVSSTSLHCVVALPALELCFQAVWFLPRAGSVPPCPPHGTSAPSAGTKVNSKVNKPGNDSVCEFVCTCIHLVREQHLSLKRALIHFQVMSRRALLHQLWTKLVHLTGMKRQTKWTSNQNSFLLICMYIQICSTWSLLRVMRSFRSSTPLLSSSSSISRVLILSCEHIDNDDYFQPQPDWHDPLTMFYPLLSICWHLQSLIFSHLTLDSPVHELWLRSLTSRPLISLVRSVWLLLSDSTSLSKCLKRLLRRSLSSWALSLSSQHTSSSFFRRETWKGDRGGGGAWCMDFSYTPICFSKNVLPLQIISKCQLSS